MGRGIEKIVAESQKFNEIVPKFRWLNGLWVEFYFNTDLEKDLEKHLNLNQLKILELIAENSHITQLQLSEIIQINEKNIRNNIKKLKELGLLRRVGSAKGGYWEVVK